MSVPYKINEQKEQASEGFYDNRPAPGVFSDNVQTGGQVSEHTFEKMDPRSGGTDKF